MNFDGEGNFIRVRHCKPLGATSKYLGVSWEAVARKWMAVLPVYSPFYVDLRLGGFDTEIAAAKAVDVWLRENGRAAEANFDLAGNDTRLPLPVPFQPPPVSYKTPTPEDLARALLG